MDPAIWAVEMGPRFWFSSGTDGQPNPLLNGPAPVALASRLRFKDLNAYSGEVFGRLEHVSGWYAKGFLGAGGITSGNLYDEDFPAGPVYSNTLSAVVGSLAYATVDLGHNLIKTDRGNVGAFIGYNYFAQNLNSTGCAQLAQGTPCSAVPIPPNYSGIVQDDHFNSLRVGLNAQIQLGSKLKLATEAAYLPRVHSSGTDYHNARMLVGPESASSGDGVMLEAILNYKITDAWDIGLGGRYWAWNMNTGHVIFNFLNMPGDNLGVPARFNATRYGVFVQTSYHQDALPSLSLPSQPMNWTGVSVGANLGGGWGEDQWSNPFPETAVGTLRNVSGFGDSISASGPLAGGQIDYHWQTGFWVWGIGADANWTNVRGENTCFSGTGGVNCQRILRSFGTITGQLGAAWDRSLVFVKAGPAWANTTYNLNANTTVLSYGRGSDAQSAWGWAVGAGASEALTDHWVVQAEYDFMMIPSHSVAFPNVSVINSQNISVRQDVNLVKMVLNYKFG